LATPLHTKESIIGMIFTWQMDLAADLAEKKVGELDSLWKFFLEF